MHLPKSAHGAQLVHCGRAMPRQSLLAEANLVTSLCCALRHEQRFLALCRFVDASSFQKCDKADDAYAQDPIAYVADELQQRGYAKYGEEVMINGYTGEEMPCHIFIGLVYYQRLRHMVKDKFQVRNRGPNYFI